MAVDLNPYLNFRGDARAALDFYQSVFGGELMVRSLTDLGMPVPPEEADNVMHGQLRTSFGLLLMASDVPSHMSYTKGENTFSVSLSGPDEEALTGYWEALSEGATIGEPLSKAPWGDSFGMLVDRFGTPWLVNIAGGASA